MDFLQRCAVRFGCAKPLVSLCVPVYGTEGLVGRFLDSVLQQAEAPLFETIVVNDGSPGTKELQRIIKTYAKRFKERGLPFVFLEHRKNLGLVEARRTAVNVALGEYLAFADSDDELPPEALHILYDTAGMSGADVVHGNTSVFGTEGEPEVRVAVFAKKAAHVHFGTLTGDAIMHGFLIEHLYSDFLWGKLFKTNLVQKAFAEIPFTYCTMAEDVLTYFFIALHADTYLGIPEPVYNYRINTGVTSRKKCAPPLRYLPSFFHIWMSILVSAARYAKRSKPSAALTMPITSSSWKSVWFLHYKERRGLCWMTGGEHCNS